MRGRSYGYSPSPSRGYDRRRRSPTPKGRYGGHERDLPSSLLVRNLRHDCRGIHTQKPKLIGGRDPNIIKLRTPQYTAVVGQKPPEDLRGLFGEFGPLKDVYLPRDYHTGAPRGFGFVQFVDPADAADAKYEMDGHILLGRELTVVFAEENRKKPSEMRSRDRVRGRSYDCRGSALRESRSPPYGRSYSRSPQYERSYSHSRDHYSPSVRRGHYSRSISPRGRRYRERSYSYSPASYGSRSHSPRGSGGRSRSRSLDYSR